MANQHHEIELPRHFKAAQNKTYNLIEVVDRSSTKYTPNFLFPVCLSIMESKSDSDNDTFLAINVGDYLHFTALNASGCIVEEWNKSLRFRTNPSSHKYCTSQKCIAIGFDAGDILVLDPYANNDSHIQLNIEGRIDQSPVSCITWVPGSSDQLISCHSSGKGYLFDISLTQEEQFPQSLPINKYSVYYRSIVGINPQICWNFSSQPITAIDFSPDGTLFAVSSRDGKCRIINANTNRLHQVFQGFFGAILCQAWSPDNQYIATGGEDDTITIWNVVEHCVTARCVGHQNWVSSIMFDQFESFHDSYRLVSSGQDNRLILWDFTVRTLFPVRRSRTSKSHQFDKQIAQNEAHSHIDRPKSRSTPNEILKVKRAQSIEDNTSVVADVKVAVASSASSTGDKVSDKVSDQFFEQEDSDLMIVFTSTQLPTIEPITSRILHHQPLSVVSCLPEAILSVCYEGIIKVWQRPNSSAPDREQSTSNNRRRNGVEVGVGVDLHSGKKR